jgi:hypothetical protein
MLEAIYDSIRCNHTVRETEAILSPYWPTSHPWSSTMWDLWRKGRRELTWAAETALHRYAGLPDPPHRVTVTSTSGEIEVIQLSDKPTRAIVVGDNTGGVTVNLLQPATAPTRRKFEVKVVKYTPPRKTPRKGISMLATTHQILLAHRLPGEAWDALLRRLCALDSPVPECPAPPTDDVAP